jgi:hypothetical protein
MCPIEIVNLSNNRPSRIIGNGQKAEVVVWDHGSNKQPGVPFTIISVTGRHKGGEATIESRRFTDNTFANSLASIMSMATLREVSELTDTVLQNPLETKLEPLDNFRRGDIIIRGI